MTKRLFNGVKRQAAEQRDQRWSFSTAEEDRDGEDEAFEFCWKRLWDLVLSKGFMLRYGFRTLSSVHTDLITPDSRAGRPDKVTLLIIYSVRSWMIEMLTFEETQTHVFSSLLCCRPPGPHSVRWKLTLSSIPIDTENNSTSPLTEGECFPAKNRASGMWEERGSVTEGGEEEGQEGGPRGTLSRDAPAFLPVPPCVDEQFCLGMTPSQDVALEVQLLLVFRRSRRSCHSAEADHLCIVTCRFPRK